MANTTSLRAGSIGEATVVDDRASVVLSARAVSQLKAYDRAVNRVVGGDEFCLLLLGIPGTRRVEEVFLVHGQQVTYSTFNVSPEKLSETNAEAHELHPELATIGLAHRHPGSTGCAFHSHTDDQYISGQLAPKLALLSLQSRCWERELEPEQNEQTGDELVYRIDRSGRQRIKLRNSQTSQASEAAQAELPAAQPGLTLAVEERHTEVFSIVFTSCMDLYCCELEYEYPTLLTDDGATQTWRKVTQYEPRVEIQETEEEFEFNQHALEQEVREQVRSRRIFGTWTSSKGWNTAGQPSAQQPSSWASGYAGTPTTGYGVQVVSSASRATQSTHDLLRDALANLREVSLRRSQSDVQRDGQSGAKLSDVADSVTALLQKVIDESWPNEVH
jgi:hypothetical protein